MKCLKSGKGPHHQLSEILNYKAATVTAAGIAVCWMSGPKAKAIQQKRAQKGGMVLVQTPLTPSYSTTQFRVKN